MNQRPSDLQSDALPTELSWRLINLEPHLACKVIARSRSLNKNTLTKMKAMILLAFTIVIVNCIPKNYYQSKLLPR